MPFDFRLPDLGEGIAEAELRRWLVREGDTVAEHQSVAEVETDKAVVELPAPRAGRILRLLQTEGAMIRVGDILLAIAGEDEDLPSEPVPKESRRGAGIVGTLPEPDDTAPRSTPPATPGVRALAREMGLSLETIRGTGPRGSITRQDLLNAAPPAGTTADDYGAVERLPLRGVRRTIARNLIQAQKQTAFVTTMEDADVTVLWELKVREEQALRPKGIHLTILPFMIKAVQHALAGHPFLNASVDEDRGEIVLKKYCNIGIAVDTTDGLMVPVIRDVAQKSIVDLAAELQALGERARSRTITLPELKGSSFTITNFGHFGGTYATPIINYPDVAILGGGRIADRPWVVDGEIRIRKILNLSLTFDHRVTDGAEAARFLADVMRYLEDPALLFIESR
jgi:pyruvate dehydrogenase E2 component (dihydrolipoyllysine-residue acetyltransferase)